MGQVAKGDNPAEEIAQHRRAPSIAALCERFFEAHVLENCKPTTQAEYRRAIDKFINPAIGAFRVVDVDFAEYVVHTFDPKPAQSQWSVGDYVRRVVGDRADPRWQISPSEGEVMPFPQNYDPMLPVFEYTITEFRGLGDGTVQQTETRPESISSSIKRPGTTNE